MVCPDCNQEKFLTWKEYLFSPRGYHDCPGCGGTYKVLTNYFHIFEIFLAGFLTGGVCMAICLYFEVEFLGIILYTLLTVISVIIPIDKSFDNHHAKVEMVDLEGG